MNNELTNSLQRRVRVIWAITTKDIVDAIKNKTTLGVILPVLFILVFYRFIPQIYGHDDQITTYLFDASGSDVAVQLADSLDLDLREVASESELKKAVSNSDVADIGVVIPADFIADSRDSLKLEAYMINWVPEAQKSETAASVEQEFSYLLERPVEISLEGNTVYHAVDSDGLGFLASVSIVFALVMIGISFLPNLMLEEQKEQTIKLLRVSPASSSDIIIAKALTGLFYTLLLGVLAWALYARVFINPLMTAGAFLLGGMLFVLAGLLLGTLVKSRQQLIMVAWAIVLPLLLPPFMEMMDDILPFGLLRVIRLIPSVALARMLRSSLSAHPDWGFYLSQMGYLAVFVLVLFGLNVLSVRRLDR